MARAKGGPGPIESAWRAGFWNRKAEQRATTPIHAVPAPGTAMRAAYDEGYAFAEANPTMFPGRCWSKTQLVSLAVKAAASMKTPESAPEETRAQLEALRRGWREIIAAEVERNGK